MSAYFRDFLVINNAVFSTSHYINNLLVLFQVMSHPKLLMKQLELLYLEHKQHSLPNQKCEFCFTWTLQNATISTHLPLLVTPFTLKTCHSMQVTQNLIFWHMTPHNLADKHQHFRKTCCLHLQNSIQFSSAWTTEVFIPNCKASRYYKYTD